MGCVTTSANSLGLQKPGKDTASERDRILAEIDKEIAYGVKVGVACARHGVPRSTYYAWKKEGPADETDEANDDAHEDSCDCAAATGSQDTTSSPTREDTP